MIKFILLLPLKIIGLLFMAIGAFLERREKERIQAARYNEKRITAELKEKDRRERAARIAMERAQRLARIEKEKAEKRKAAESKKQFQIEQAKTDIVHYEQQRRELLKLYDELKKQFDAAGTDKQKEIVFRKQIALNNQIRGVDRQIEKAQYIINRTG